MRLTVAEGYVVRSRASPPTARSRITPSVTCPYEVVLESWRWRERAGSDNPQPDGLCSSNSTSIPFGERTVTIR